MWYWVTWFSGGVGSIRLMAGSDDLKGPIQARQFCDSVIFQRKHCSTFRKCQCSPSTSASGKTHTIPFSPDALTQATQNPVFNTRDVWGYQRSAAKAFCFISSLLYRKDRASRKRALCTRQPGTLLSWGVRSGHGKCVGMQSWKLSHTPRKERVRGKEGTEQSVLKTGIMQQRWMKEGNKTTWCGKKKRRTRMGGEKKKRKEWHKIKYVAGKAKKNFIFQKKENQIRIISLWIKDENFSDAIRTSEHHPSKKTPWSKHP